MALLSPRLAALERAVAAGERGATAAFWSSVAAEGTPMIEATDDPNSVLVTFVWRGGDDTQNVRVLSDNVLPASPLDNAMALLDKTDVWYRSYRLPADLRFEYLLAPNDPVLAGVEPESWEAKVGTWQPDPLNPKQLVLPDDGEHPEWEEWFSWSTWTKRVNSLVELPAAPLQPLIMPPPEDARGSVEKHRLESAVLGKSRAVYVYSPAGYDPDGDALALGIWSDAWVYSQIVPVPTILDKLIAEGAIEPMVAVVVDHPTLDARMEELSLPEPLPPFARFVTDELLPWIRRSYRVTTDPRRTMLAGGSNGGDMAAAIALQRPDLFGAVLSQSGTFGRSPDGNPEPEWLARLVAESDPKAVRFYLEAGRLETDPGGSSVPILVANRHLRTVLRAKGYEVTLAEYSGGHQPVCWRGTLGQGITAVMA